MRTIRSTAKIYTLATAVSLTCLAFAGSATGAEYDYGVNSTNPSSGLMFLDLVSRPLTAAATVAGAGVWVVTLPFSLVGGNAGEAAKTLVAEPFTYTFARPLGHM